MQFEKFDLKEFFENKGSPKKALNKKDTQRQSTMTLHSQATETAKINLEPIIEGFSHTKYVIKYDIIHNKTTLTASDG